VTFCQFFFRWLKEAFHVSWHAGHVAHQVSILLFGILLLVSIVMGWHEDNEGEPKALFLIPLAAAFVFLPGGLVWYAFSMYQEELEKRTAQENVLKSERWKNLRQEVDLLPENSKAALRELVTMERLGAGQIQAKYPGVEFYTLSKTLGILQHELPPVDVWTVNPPDLDSLRGLLFPAAPSATGGRMQKSCQLGHTIRRAILRCERRIVRFEQARRPRKRTKI
jgi:hypothetical protein